jgi:hypothetical protein
MAGSPVVTDKVFKMAGNAVHAASLRWHDLRDFFHQSCLLGGMSNLEADFMLGHELGDPARFVNPSRAADYLRNKYVEVEKRFFV